MQDCEIQPWVFSDHDCVNLHLNLKDVFSHRPGIWRFNVSLLAVDVFCSLISDITTRHVALKTAFPSIHKWWDTLKDLFKVASKTFSKQQQRKMNSQLVNLTNRLIQAKGSLIAGDTSASILIEQLESKIQHLQLGNRGGAKVRSRAQWIESGDKLTRFFFSPQFSFEYFKTFWFWPGFSKVDNHPLFWSPYANISQRFSNGEN